MNRRQLVIALSAAGFSGVARGATVQAAGTLRAVIDGPQRSANNRARDPFRHPFETLSFWGLAPGMTVVEIDPSGGYWTEILAPYLKQTGGRYVAAIGGGEATFRARFSDPALWGPIEIANFSAASGPLVPAGSADMVITARNIHDWMWTPGLLDKFFADFNAALKRDAILGVEEHRADPRAMIDDAHDGYVSTAFVIAEAKKTGFRLDGNSEINANPRDTKDHPFGVWTLPPTRRTHQKDQPTPAGFDPAKYEAIGESDRMTLRFRKV
jgi:predicted methyltransferase